MLICVSLQVFAHGFGEAGTLSGVYSTMNHTFCLFINPQAKQNPSPPAAVADPSLQRTLYMLTLRGLGATPTRQTTLPVVPTTNTTTRLSRTTLRPLQSTTSRASPCDHSRLPHQRQQQQQRGRSRSLVVAHVAQRKPPARSAALHTTHELCVWSLGCSCMHIHTWRFPHPFLSELSPA